jgi:D-alanyl-lipoteichoic acid acyltransferase DltB (MBOAT superfamily)
LYLSFFPQLVMGPIVRAHVLLLQIERRPKLNEEQGSQAIFRIGIGLVKKLVIADFLRAQIVDPVFSNPEMYSSLETLTAVYAYSFQIYADFSGYSDIAIGSAALLGVEIPENFLAPYRAKSLREFWQRWHITLSTWLRDYLYIPLGGSRRSPRRTYVNLMVTMILGGLWHGPALTFVIWGTIHGAALVATRLLQRARVIEALPGRVREWGGLFATFHVVTIAWVFFRAPSFDSAGKVFSSLAELDMDAANISWSVLLVLALAAATHFTPTRWMKRVNMGFHALAPPIQAAFFLAAVFLAQRIASTDVAPFIYSQF